MKKQNENIKLYNLPFLSGIEVISGHNIINDFRRHIHKTYIIGLIEQGKRVISYPGGATQVSANEIFIINPYQVHSCSTEKQFGHSYKILSVSSKTMQLIASQISEKQERRPYFKKTHYRNDFLSEKFIRLLNVIKNHESDIQVESKIHSFLTYLILFFSTPSESIHISERQKDSIKMVCQYIKQNFTKNLSLKKLAEIACLSPFHFQREFKKNIGITPHEYLSDFRISESQKKLLKSENIADVAIQFGFSDQSYFSKVFRKTVGVPPGKYCKTNKNC